MTEVYTPSQCIPLPLKHARGIYLRIEPVLPRQRGNVSLSNLTVLNAILFVAEQGCKWRGLPKRFGNWHTIYTRMNRWAKSGVLDAVFEKLQREQLIRIKIEAISMDSTIVKVHPDGTGALKKTVRKQKERGSMICYVVQHNDTGRRYVGITKSTLSVRKSNHESQAKNGSHNSKFHSALRKFGDDAFSWELLAEGSERVMRLLERILIHEWETNGPGGFNTDGGHVGQIRYQVRELNDELYGPPLRDLSGVRPVNWRVISLGLVQADQRVSCSQERLQTHSAERSR